MFSYNKGKAFWRIFLASPAGPTRTYRLQGEHGVEHDLPFFLSYFDLVHVKLGGQEGFSSNNVREEHPIAIELRWNGYCIAQTPLLIS